MLKPHNILPRKIGFFISSTGKIENVQEFKVKLFEWLFIDDSHIRIIWLHVIVFTEILCIFEMMSVCLIIIH